MIDSFKPNWMINKIYDISPQFLKSHGIKAVFTDLDNTLIPWNKPYGTAETRAWMQQLADEHIKLVIVSNNRYGRVQKAADNLALPFVSRSLKPFSFGIKRGLKRYHLQPQEVIMVGDQLLTDVWGANNSGVKSVWVKPLINSDALNTRVNRLLERLIKNRLVKKYPDLHWQEEINDR